MRAIWGIAIPGAYGEPKGETVTQAIVELHNVISTTLAEKPEDYSPILFREDNGTLHPGYWADGFWQGMTLNMPDWAPLMTVENQAMFLPVMLYRLHRLGVTEDDIPKHAVEPKAKDEWQRIPEAVNQIEPSFCKRVSKVTKHNRQQENTLSGTQHLRICGRITLYL